MNQDELIDKSFELEERTDGMIYAINSRRIAVMVENPNDDETGRAMELTINDVIDYYETQARNISSGIRVLGHGKHELASDWRCVD